MASELKSKTVHGLLWSSIERFSTQGISFAFSIILARILTPEDYGVVAIVTVFTTIASLFIDTGFGSALIRKPEISEEDKSTALIFNVLISVVCYLILFILAPFIADFYHNPLLSPLLRVTAIPLIIGALCGVHRSLLTKAMNFKSIAKITLTSTVLSGIIGVVMAYQGYGVWALVAQNVISVVISCLFIWIAAKWRPRTWFNKESFHYLFGYGSKLLASGLLDTVYNNIYPLVIGKFYTPAQLGYFSKAVTFTTLPSSNLTGVLQRVTFPLLSMIQNEDERLRTNYRRILRNAAFAIFPLMMGLCALASPLVNLLLTSKWDACVIYLQIICFGMMWYPVHAINLNLLQVKGRSDLFLRLEILKKIMGVIVLCITIPLGITAMCIGIVISSYLALFINTYYTGKLIDVGYIRQMKDVLPILINSMVMGAVAYLATLITDSNAIKLVIGTLAGIVYYLSMSYLCKSDELKEVWGIIRRK